MRLSILEPSDQPHKGVISSLSWAPPAGAGSDSSGGGSSRGGAGAGGGGGSRSRTALEVVSAGDDGALQRWAPGLDRLESLGSNASAGVAVTSMAWLSGGGGGRGSAASSVAALACTDGTLRLVNGATGREEKRVSATTAGAVICVAADPSGSTLATGNEDGAVKVWSRAGMLRATVATADSPVFAVCWDSTSERLLYASGKQLSVRSVAGDRASSKASTSWKAHDGAVLCADWCAVHSLIVSGGEDCRFKVWDAEGRALFASAPMLHPITAVAWAPRGESFAVGSFETLRLCDRAGWSLARQSLASTNVGSGRVGTAAAASASVSGAGAASGSASASGAATAAASVSGGGADGDAGSGGAFGSVFALAWSADGTALAVGGAGGRVVLAQPLGRRVSEGGLFAEHSSSREVRVVDASDGTTELLELRDRVTHVSLAYSRLVVCTETQCHVYDAGRRAWGTPHSSDLKAPATLLLQGTRHILIADASGAFTLLGEDGRPTSTAFGSAIARGLGSTAARAAACADASSLALAPDCIAVLDRADGRTVRTFDIRSGRAVGAVYEHPVPVRQIALSQFTPGLPERRLAVVDTAGDLWVTPVMAPEPEKLASMVESAAWCDAGDMLLACADGKQVLWHCPAAVWVDRDLCERAKEETPAPALGRIPRILTYRGSRCVVRRGDGAVIHSAVNTNTPLLYELVRGARWEHAVRLCRQAKEQPLWATLASLSLSASQLDTAEIALAALGMSDKLAFVLHVRDVPSEEGRAAEMALFRRCPDEAEAVLLHASPPLLYRAVKLNIRLFRWERALQLAREADAGVGGSPSLTEIVVGARQRLLEALGREETLVSFKEAQAAIGGAVDWDRVQTTKASQREAEIAAVSGGAYGGERG